MLRLLRRDLLAELAKFGFIGAFNLVVDVGLFNLFRTDLLTHKPLSAKAASLTIATVSSYFMNRHWTWSHRARTGLTRELALFTVISFVGLGIAEACLAVSHYGLGLDSVLDDNVSTNGVGMVIGTVWRFWAFKRWVFLPRETLPEARRDAAPAAPV